MILLSVYLLCIYLRFGFSTTTMVVVWGQPNSISQCSNGGVTTMSSCKSSCFNQANCVIAYMNLNNNICYLCPFGAVGSVTQLTYTSKMKVAMKINNAATTCPASYPSQGRVDSMTLPISNQAIPSYTITYASGTWTFANKQTTCPSGWYFSWRSKGPCCIQVFYNPTAKYNWANANQQCQALGGVLSGIENSAEYNFIYSTAKSLWPSATGTGFLWLGAQVKTGCVPPSSNPAACSNGQTVAQWTDTTVTGTAGFSYWVSGQPDGKLSALTGARQSCIVLWMYYSPYSGLMDDAFCSMGAGTVNAIPTYYALAYACSKTLQ